MGETQIKRHTPALDAHVEFWVRNPTASLTDASRTLGVSPAWCSTIKNSDAFRRLYREKLGEYDETMFSAREQALGVASQALERLGERVAVTNDENFLLAAADKLLTHGRDQIRAGPGVQVNILGAATLDELQAARRSVLEG